MSVSCICIEIICKIKKIFVSLQLKWYKMRLRDKNNGKIILKTTK